jgi:predicted helicase
MPVISPQHRAIAQYYQELETYRQHQVTHELATKTAFQTLLNTFAPSAGWVMIPEQRLANGKQPDATFRDNFNLPRGYWEAKDTHDDLPTEIRKKIAAGYSTINTIFEDTQWAVLYQSGKPALEVDLRQPGNVADLLNQFFTYAEPEIATFEHAVQEFKERIPELAKGLLELIQREHRENKAFQDAFAGFYALCSTSLDPNISATAIQEMLVQHLLTERLFRTVFNNSDFTHRNVIAAEIEKVIGALTSRVFNRQELLRQLDRFYVAIEGAAKGLVYWSEKQAFLDTVYERFFQGFSVKQADTHGIKYTPQEIVDFMCSSVEEVLHREFGTSLSEPGVKIIDPCTGTGNFIVNLVRRISGATLEHKFAEDLFANEVMLLPYYIASLNIEHAYYERTGQYRTFEGMCFVDTLELAEGRTKSLWVEEKNTERVEREKAAPIMVVIGNPPYNLGQENENDNNKNRRYPVVDERTRETYVMDSTATNRNKLSDAYVKFFRWATDRLAGRDGIVCFVSNNSFVDQIAFDGMRKHLLRDFTRIYHLDLHGNVRKNPKLSGTTHNVFGIQVGVGITVAIRSSAYSTRELLYYRVPDDWRKEEKLAYLREMGGIGEIEWEQLEPDSHHTWLTQGLRTEFETFCPLGLQSVKGLSTAHDGCIFETYSPGVITARDSWVYDFHTDALAQKVMSHIEAYNSEVDRWKRAGEPDDVDNFVLYDDGHIKWSRDLKSDLRRKRYAQFSTAKVRRALYRPFTRLLYFLDSIMSQDIFMQARFFPTGESERENISLAVTGIGSEKPFMALAANSITDFHLVGAGASTQCFPLYTYAEDGSNRQENVTDWALGQFQAAHGASITKRDIFHYVYGVLHHPQYRERYAENLKRELPRIPLLPERRDFETCVRIGAELAKLHLTYDQAPEYPLSERETPGVMTQWRVEKMKLSSDRTAVIYNQWLTLAGIPNECFEYRLGNRSALEWVIDQYQVSVDQRSGIVSDPNRPNDPAYIVRLVKQVVTVSVETVRLVKELAATVSLDSVIGAALVEVPAEGD